MKRSIAQIHDLTEGVSGMQVDRTAGIIRGVRILGAKSANGREYSASAIDKAAKLYEGIRVNVNHPREPGKDRQLADRFGKLVNVRKVDGGLSGDLHFLKTHGLAPTVCESAERMPELMGLSHNAQGRLESRGGKMIVEEILSVRSVDLVSDPATTKSLFESDRSMKTVKEIYEAVFAAKLQGTTLLEEFPPGVMDAPVEVQADADGDGQIDAAFKSMVTGVLDSDMDLKAKLKKIADILKAQDKLTGEAKAPPAKEPPKEEEKETPESLKAELSQLKAEKSCRTLLESLKVAPDEVKVSALAALPESQREAVAKTWVGQPGGKTPKSGAPASNLTESKIPTDAAGTVSFLRG